jgi:hypothetical protein
MSNTLRACPARGRAVHSSIAVEKSPFGTVLKELYLHARAYYPAAVCTDMNLFYTSEKVLPVPCSGRRVLCLPALGIISRKMLYVKGCVCSSLIFNSLRSNRSDLGPGDTPPMATS